MSATSLLQPTDAEALRLAKTLLRSARHGALATLTPQTGAPQVTRVGVSTDFDGAPVLLISGLAAHFPALAADPRCSLLLGETGKGDPMAHARITITANARILEPDDANTPRISARYLAHNPKAKLYAGLGDFRFVRLDPVAASLNGGFGRAYALAGADLLSSADPALAAAEGHALEHMNQDHADAVDIYARYYAKAPGGKWVLTGIDAEGIDIADGDDVRRIFFDKTLSVPQDMHMTLVQMARTARGALMAV
ncbi:MAG: HugZ family protein [Devosia sp.]|nr:HugZ family protein [Devosia sp.]